LAQLIFLEQDRWRVQVVTAIGRFVLALKREAAGGEFAAELGGREGHRLLVGLNS
jgi:hypothetical protein